jgi:hypothetical protein
MVKMYTDEPSVILKLKKGGKVKHHKEGGEHHGHHSMHSATAGHMHGAHHAFESEHGHSPKKPSMAERRKAMNPNQYAKGGKVAHKVLGGVMPGAAPAAPMAPMGQAALANMTPAQRVARAAMVRKALTGMKKGGHAEAHIEKLEKELHHHERLSANKAHGKHHKASGGEIDKAETRTTIEKEPKKFAKTKVDDGQKHDKAHGTGEIHEGKPGGYKLGGHAHHKHHSKHHKALGGTIEGNEGKFENTEMHDGDHEDRVSGTGGVRMGNSGGFKHGGKAHHKGHHKMHHKADGGSIDRKLTRTTVEGGDWENRAADTSKPGKSNTKTGEVKESNAGGFKHGGHASKKAYATGGNVVDDGKAVKMPHHFVSKPVANSLQSGTFKKGGKVKKFDTGGSSNASNDVPASVVANSGANNREQQGWNYAKRQSLDPVGDEINGVFSDIGNAVKSGATKAWNATRDYFSPPAGSVTKTEKSVTVSPGKKRGGRAK